MLRLLSQAPQHQRGYIVGSNSRYSSTVVYCVCACFSPAAVEITNDYNAREKINARQENGGHFFSQESADWSEKCC